ncbi:MAG: hypothetical protein QOG53_6 [Frankiales bacterium]|jgi:hypothetical protein|nr:hypothetical protein [Frankiales bacterium]
MAEKDPSAKSRVADALKAGLEKQLIGEADDAMLAGHGSHVVSAVQPLEALAAKDLGASGNWSQEKINSFAEKIAKLVAEES